MNMNLQDFCALYDIDQVYPTRESVKVFTPPDIDEQTLWDLFHLDDYVVSSALAGPSYLLVKREEFTPPENTNRLQSAH